MRQKLARSLRIDAVKVKQQPGVWKVRLTEPLVRRIALLIEKGIGVMTQLKRLLAAERATVVWAKVKTVMRLQTNAQSSLDRDTRSLQVTVRESKDTCGGHDA